MRRFALLIVVVLVAAGIVGVIVYSPPATASSSWSIVSSPNPSPAFSLLSGVSCVAVNSCKAVGDFNINGSNDKRVLIESWNGTRWSFVRAANDGDGANGLAGVSCRSASSCTAVGGYGDRGIFRTLIESWNGTTWSIVPSPHLGTTNSFLDSVSCGSERSCKAVGYYTDGGIDRTLIESWNGTRWSWVPSPNNGKSDNDTLASVSCVSPNFCTAVGHYNNGNVQDEGTLIESWNGTTWSIVPSPAGGPSYNQLNGVSCVSASSCTAVGYYGNVNINTTITDPLIESWNGAIWSVVPSPTDVEGEPALYSVSCVSASSCTAAGADAEGNTSVTFIESWNGTTWSIVPSPGFVSYFLWGVSCVSANSCTAAGSIFAEGTHTLIESSS